MNQQQNKKVFDDSKTIHYSYTKSRKNRSNGINNYDDYKIINYSKISNNNDSSNYMEINCRFTIS